MTRHITHYVLGLLMLCCSVRSFADGTRDVSEVSTKISSLFYFPPSYGSYRDCPAENRIYFRIQNSSTEKLYLGFHWVTRGSATTVANMYYRVLNASGTQVLAPTLCPQTGAGFITSHAQALVGPVVGTQNAGGYTPVSFTPTPATYTLTWTLPLPVKLADFTATLDQGKVKLGWLTYTELNNKGFAVERSLDGRIWKQIDFVSSQAANGNSSEKLTYVSHDDHPLSGLSFYRLKQVGIDRSSTLSEVRQITTGKSEAISIYPNPAIDIVYIHADDITKISGAKLSDIKGRVVYQTDNVINGIHLNGLTQGVYLLQIEEVDGKSTSFRLVKND